MVVVVPPLASLVVMVLEQSVLVVVETFPSTLVLVDTAHVAVGDLPLSSEPPLSSVSSNAPTCAPPPHERTGQ